MSETSESEELDEELMLKLYTGDIFNDPNFQAIDENQMDMEIKKEEKPSIEQSNPVRSTRPTKFNGNRQGTRYYSQASERPPNGQTNQKTVPKPEEQQIKTAKETQTNQSSPPATPVLGGSTAPAPTKSQPEANKSVSTNGKWRACYICQGDNHPPGARVPAVSSYLLQQDCLEYKCRGTLLCANCGYSDHLMKDCLELTMDGFQKAYFSLNQSDDQANQAFVIRKLGFDPSKLPPKPSFKRRFSHGGGGGGGPPNKKFKPDLLRRSI